MAFLDQEISFDIGHLVLLVALIGFIFFVANKCKLACGGKGDKENLEVQKVHWKSCRCPDCTQACYQKAKNGELYGCNPNNPYVPYSPEECEYQYRKCTLHGCGVA